MAKKKIPPVFGTPEYIKDSAKFLKQIGISCVRRPFKLGTWYFNLLD